MTSLTLDRALFFSYVAVATLAYNLGLHNLVPGDKQKTYITRSLFLVGVYFWVSCFPWAIRILFDQKRRQKFGFSGIVHIVSCSTAIAVGLVIFFNSFILQLPLDPSNPVILVYSVLASVSMVSSFFMFHLLPKLSKKFFRRFFVASLTSLLIALHQIVIFRYYRRVVLNDDINNNNTDIITSSLWLITEPFSDPIYYGPVVIPLSIVNVLGALLNSADDIIELVDRTLPERMNVSSSPSDRRSSAVTHGSIWITIRSFIKSDSMSKMTGRRISYNNSQAHTVVKTDWPQIFIGGTELTFALILFSSSWVLLRSGQDALIHNGLEFYATGMDVGKDDHDAPAMPLSAQFGQLQMAMTFSYLFYAGVVFPLSLVLKGKMSAEKGRFLILLYALMSGSLASFFSGKVGAYFYRVIGAVFVALFLFATPRLPTVSKNLCPAVMVDL